MQKIKNYFGYMCFIILVIIDLLVFLIPKSYDFNVQFWTGFVFIQISFLGYSFLKYFFNEVFNQNVIDCIFFIYIVCMVLSGLVAFLTPYMEITYLVLLLSNILISVLVGFMIFIEIYKYYKNNKSNKINL